MSHDATIQIRISKRDLSLIDQAAKELGITRSALIRHAAEAHARRVTCKRSIQSSRLRRSMLCRSAHRGI